MSTIITTIGNGNCGFNSFAIGLAYLYAQHDNFGFAEDDTRAQAYLQQMVEKIGELDDFDLALEEDDTEFSDIQKAEQQFLKFLTLCRNPSGELNFNKLQLNLAPILRQLHIDAILSHEDLGHILKQHLTEELFSNIESLYEEKRAEDTKWPKATHEIEGALAYNGMKAALKQQLITVVNEKDELLNTFSSELKSIYERRTDILQQLAQEEADASGDEEKLAEIRERRETLQQTIDITEQLKQELAQFFFEEKDKDDKTLFDKHLEHLSTDKTWIDNSNFKILSKMFHIPLAFTYPGVRNKFPLDVFGSGEAAPVAQFYLQNVDENHWNIELPSLSSTKAIDFFFCGEHKALKIALAEHKSHKAYRKVRGDTVSAYLEAFSLTREQYNKNLLPNEASHDYLHDALSRAGSIFASRKNMLLGLWIFALGIAIALVPTLYLLPKISSDIAMVYAGTQAIASFSGTAIATTFLSFMALGASFAASLAQGLTPMLFRSRVAKNEVTPEELEIAKQQNTDFWLAAFAQRIGDKGDEQYWVNADKAAYKLGRKAQKSTTSYLWSFFNPEAYSRFFYLGYEERQMGLRGLKARGEYLSTKPPKDPSTPLAASSPATGEGTSTPDDASPDVEIVEPADEASSPKSSEGSASGPKPKKGKAKRKGKRKV